MARERRRLANAKRRTLATGAALSASALFAGSAQAATLTVTGNGDDPAGTLCTGGVTCTTLRDAITQSNADSSADTIVFANTVTSPITLSSINGPLTINAGAGVAINGPGASKLAVSGNDVTQVFSITTPSVTESISGLTITKGAAGSGAGGGAIGDTAGNSESLSLTNDVISDSTSTNSGGGGGIYDEANLTISGSTITGNSDTAGRGGGIAVPSLANITITNSTISGNTALSGGGIGGTADFLVTGSHITGNHAISGNSSNGGGGGIGAYDGTLAVNGTTVSGNTSTNAGGGIEVNTKYGATIANSTISGNTSIAGGGVQMGSKRHKYNPVQVLNSTISQNHGARGGGVEIKGGKPGNPVTIRASTLSGNQGGASSFGGGLLVTGGVSSPVETIDSTISGNAATHGGGVSLSYGSGSPPLIGTGSNANGSIAFDNSTIAANSATASAGGGGIYLGGYGTSPVKSGTASITSTIVSGNAAGGAGNDLSRAAGSTSGGFDGAFSLIQHPGNAPLLVAKSLILGANPKLGALGNHGGPTRTMLPSPTSPVIDQGKAPSSLSTDQRGDPRTVVVSGIPKPPGGDGTDIGSVELPARSVVVPPQFTASVRGKLIGGPTTPLLVGNSTPVTCTAKTGKLSSCVIEVRTTRGTLLASGEVTSKTPAKSLSTKVTPTAAGFSKLAHNPLGLTEGAKVVAGTTTSGSHTVSGKVHLLAGPEITLPIGKRSSKLSKSLVKELGQVAKLLTRARKITCTAYSDQGSGDAALTKAQAKNACNTLVKDGFKGKVKSVGKGHADLIASPHSSKNRRLVFTFSF